MSPWGRKSGRNGLTALSLGREALEVRGPEDPLLAEALKEAGERWSGSGRYLPLFALPALLRALRAGGLSPFPREALEGAKEAFEARFAEAARNLEAHPLLLPEQKEDAKKVLRPLYLSLAGGAPRAFLPANGTETGKTRVYANTTRAAKAVGLPALLGVPNEEEVPLWTQRREGGDERRPGGLPSLGNAITRPAWGSAPPQARERRAPSGGGRGTRGPRGPARGR
jgi:hypothetical protein